MKNPKDCRTCHGARKDYAGIPCWDCTGKRDPDLRWHAYKQPGYWHVRSPRQLGGKYQHFGFATGAEVLTALAGGGGRG
jgi:hypothetical protein